MLVAGCLTTQQHASVSQGWVWLDDCACYHTETKLAILPSYSMGTPVQALTPKRWGLTLWPSG